MFSRSARSNWPGLSESGQSEATESEESRAGVSQSEPHEFLSATEKLGYGLGDTASNLYWKTFEFFLLFFYTDVFGLSASSVATMFLVTRLWDAVNDPIVGYLADRTRTRWGRFRPYLIWMSLPLAITAAMTFYTPGFSDSGKLLYAYVTYTLVMMAYTAVNTPYGALMGVISSRSSERTSVSTYRFVAAFVGAILVQYFTLDLVAWFGGTETVLINGVAEQVPNQQQGFFRTVIFYGVISIALFWVTFMTTRERVQPLQDRGDTPVEDIWFLLSSRRLHQILLVAMVMAISFASELRVEKLLWIALAYVAMSAVSYLVSSLARRIKLNEKLSSSPPAAPRVSSFQHDFQDLLGNGPWLVLFLYGLLLLVSGFVRNGAILYYFKYYSDRPDLVSLFLVAGSGSAIVGMLLAKPLAMRWGKRQVLLVSNLIAGVATASFFFIDPSAVWGMFLVHGFASLVMGPVAVLLWAMYADVADYSEWKTRRRATGLVFSAATFSQKLGCSIGAAMAAWLLSQFAYVAPIDGIESIQSGQTQLGLRLMMSFIPAFFLIAAAGSLLLYRIDSSMLARIELDLSRRKITP